MRDKFDVKQICEARVSLFPDGGYVALHHVKRRSFLRRLRDRFRQERFALALVFVVSLLASFALYALTSTRVVDGVAATAFSVIRDAASTEDGRAALRDGYESMSSEDRDLVTEVLGR